MNMAEANNAFFAASEVGVCLLASVRVFCVCVCCIDNVIGLKGKARY